MYVTSDTENNPRLPFDIYAYLQMSLVIIVASLHHIWHLSLHHLHQTTECVFTPIMMVFVPLDKKVSMYIKVSVYIKDGIRIRGNCYHFCFVDEIEEKYVEQCCIKTTSITYSAVVSRLQLKNCFNTFI